MEKNIIADFAARNKGLISGALGALLLSNFLNVLLPMSIGLFYEIVLHQQGPKGRIMHWLPLSITQVQDFMLFFAGIVALKSALTYFEKYWTGLVGERFSRDLRERLFTSQLRHPLATHRQRPVGKYLLRYSGDLQAVRQFVTKGLLVFTGDVFFLACALALLCAIHTGLALVVLATLTVSGGVIFLLSRRLRVLMTKRRNQRSKNLGFVSARLQAFYTLKSFNRETPETQEFGRLSRRLYRLGARYFRLSAFIQALFPLFFFGGVALVMLLAVQLGERLPAGIHKSDVLVFILLLLYMRGVMRRLLQVNLVWQSGGVSLKKLVNLIGLPGEERGEPVLPPGRPGQLTFENVSFAYETAGPPLIDGLSFICPPCSITLVRGAQGSGKSTLLRLIQKICVPQSGVLRLDGVDYAELSAFEVRKKVSIVSDETPLLGDTVFKAISYGQLYEKRVEARAVIEQLQIQLAADPEDTLDFKLEEQARNLSVGERTMLQLARALLTRKKIILLDEPLQRLDAERQAILIRTLNKLKKRRTILIVSENPPADIAVDQTIQL